MQLSTSEANSSQNGVVRSASGQRHALAHSSSAALGLANGERRYPAQQQDEHRQRLDAGQRYVVEDVACGGFDEADDDGAAECAGAAT